MILGIITTLIKYLGLSQKEIIKIKQEKNFQEFGKKIASILQTLKIKFALFFFLTFILLLIMDYYTICFCGIYVNTQIHLIKDTLISFGLSLVYPFCLYLIPGIFRIHSLNNKNKDNQYSYKFSLLLQII